MEDQLFDVVQSFFGVSRKDIEMISGIVISRIGVDIGSAVTFYFGGVGFRGRMVFTL